MEYLSDLNKNFWNSNMKLLIEIVKFSELKYQISDPNINLKNSNVNFQNASNKNSNNNF
jgi:hypothetical protein